MIFLWILLALTAGAGAVWMWFSPRVKNLQEQNARLTADEARLQQTQDALRAQEQSNAALRVDLARAEQERASLVREKDLVEKHFKDLSAVYQAQFADLANKILEEKSKGLDGKSKEVLAPLRQDLETFVKRVSDMEHRHSLMQARFDERLDEVIKSTAKIDQSALHLTNAIKGEAIVRGSWGEEALKRILDAAGMKEGLDYFQQVSEEGKRVDVQIALPGDRWIVVDSKTIFNHYAAYYNEADPKKKADYLAEHVKDVKKTIKDLSSKKYFKKFLAQGDKVQPDYTLMFVYPESALVAACEQDADILNDAWKNNIALVSATSLMSTLKMVSKLWDIDKQHEYMEDLKEDILKLMEKFNDFLVNFAKAENAISAAADAVRVARGHIDGDKGAFLPVAQRIADIYEAPVTKINANLLKKQGYAYNGGKSKSAKAAVPAKKDTPLLEADVSREPGLFS